MKTVFSFLFIGLFCASSYAQNQPHKKKDIEIKRTPTLGKHDKDDDDEDEDEELKSRTYLKVGVLSLLVGEIPIGVEYAITRKISFETSAILTHCDYVTGAFHSRLIEDSYSPPTPFAPQFINLGLELSNRRIRVGFGIRGEFRFYPNRVCDGFFLSAGASQKSFRYSADVRTDSLDDKQANFNYKMRELRGGLGVARFIDENDVIFLEGSLGISYRKFYANSYPVYTVDEIEVAKSFRQMSRTSLVPYLNLKFGFRF